MSAKSLSIFIYISLSLISYVSSSIKLELNENKTILYLFHDDACAWVGTWGKNCIAKYISGSPVIISEDKTQHIIKSMITERTWIGGSNSGNKLAFKWVDGSYLNYSNWAPGEPDNKPVGTNGDGDYCVSIGVNGLWEDDPCYWARHSIRQFNVTPTLGRELYHNITKKKFPISKEAIDVLNQIDPYVSTLTPELDLSQVDKLINETISLNGTIHENNVSKLFRKFLSLIRKNFIYNKESEDKVEELKEYKEGLEYNLDQMESSINRHEHHIENLRESYREHDLHRISNEKRFDNLEHDIRDIKNLNRISNAVDVNTNMTLKFLKFLESNEHINRKSKMISDIFYAIPFIVFGSIIWYYKRMKSPNRNVNEFQFRHFSNNNEGII